MPKVIPDVPKKPDLELEPSHRYDIELVTPMFGGGVEPRVNDRCFPIRPTAIRGQLQFWWRATVGAEYSTLKDLRTAQSEIWGSTEQASRVRVGVEVLRVSDPVPCAKIEWDQHARRDQGGWRTHWQPPFDVQDSALPYVLFPFQGETPPPNRNATITMPPAFCVHQARFRLNFWCPADTWSRVEPAVWAWVNLGGLGGRTRRGCGAMRCKELAPRDHTHLAEQLKRFGPQQSEARDWPTIAECILVREKPGESLEAWNWLMGQFRYFRQGVDFARNPGQYPNRPGRSRYPEPETIRRVTGRHSVQHPRLSHIPDDAFPRAELGLPIVFHFKDDRGGDPPDTVLYPANGSYGDRRERMASPLILKSLALADGEAIPLILRLRAPLLTEVDLRRGNESLQIPPTTVIRGARLSTYRHSPLAGSSNGSALEAFLNFARSEGFREVTR